MNLTKNLFFSLLLLLITISCEKEETQPQPSITNLSISEGEVGTSVTINGTNFGTVAANVSVFFNTIETNPVSVSNTSVVAKVPAGASTGVVKVKVKSLEASGPTFTVLQPVTVSASPLSITINENPINGGLLGTVSASTNRGNLSYSLVSQSVTGAMAINSTTGILTVANVAAFDFEVNPILTAVVSVANGSETATANITITLSNVTEVAVDNFTATVTENVDNGIGIGSMNVQTGAPTFSISSQTPSGALRISSTGQLSVLNSTDFDFELRTSISATITYSGGGETKTATATITITDEVEINVANFTATVAENSAINTSIGNVNATVPTGPGSIVAYAITTQSPAGALAINGSTGELTVANASLFDFETNPTITATYSATNLSETKTASVTITLTDVNEAAGTWGTNLVAGSTTTTGCTTGTGNALRFTNVFFGEVVTNANNNLEFTLADWTCGVRKLVLANTLITSSIHNTSSPFNMYDVVRVGSYYLATYFDPTSGAGNILRIPSDGSAVSNFLGNSAVTYPTGLARDANGNIYVAESGGRKIKKFSSTGTILAIYGSGANGGADGTASTATFARTIDLQVDASGNIYVADRYSIRKIDPNGNVTTLAGANIAGDAVGTGANARFNEIHGIGILPNGNIIIADKQNGKIKQLDTNGDVTTLLSGVTNVEGIIIHNNNSEFYFTRQSAIHRAYLNGGS